MTLEELDGWLDVYGSAWERKDVDAFVSCFAEDAVYAWGPWGEPLRGHDEIRARTEQAVATQEDIRFGHEPLAITPDGRGIARWWVSTREPDGSIEENFEAEEPSGERGSAGGATVRQLELRGEEEARPTSRRRGGLDNEGIFLVTLDGAGNCTEFREWWNSRTRPAS